MEITMENQVVELSLEEQQKIHGGDWYDTVFGYLDALLLIAGFAN